MSVTAADDGVDLLLFTWNFGNGTTGTDVGTASAYKGPKNGKTFNALSRVTSTVTHTYTNPGVYTVTVTVNNGNGGTASTTLNALINNPTVTTNASQFTVNKTALKFTFPTTTER